MRYWYDTEFIENGETIDLLSIGIVANDGRELYLENAEADLDKANDWIRANVLEHLHLYEDHGIPACTHAGCPVRTSKEIASRLEKFCDPEKYGKPELWGYYSSYDHVALCQLFGTMMNLPKGWPMYTRDLKQWCDQLGNPRLPQQENGEHHALADARWNREAWRFLTDFSSKMGSNNE